MKRRAATSRHLLSGLPYRFMELRRYASKHSEEVRQ